MKDMEDFTKAAVNAINKKLNGCLFDFSTAISQSHKESFEKQKTAMNLITKGVPTIAKKLSQVCEFLPKMEGNLSTQNSRFM